MPFYEYLCELGHEFEVEQRITEDPLEACTRLGVNQRGEEVQCCSPCCRLISNTSFKFKGGSPTPKYHQ